MKGKRDFILCSERKKKQMTCVKNYKKVRKEALISSESDLRVLWNLHV